MNYKLLNENALPPVRAHADDAGADLRTPWPMVIAPHDHCFIDTGVALEIPNGLFGMVCGKSGLAAKGIVPVGGIVDSSYRGAIKVILENHTDREYKFDAGDKIAQIIFIPCVSCNFNQVVTLDEGLTGRGSNGFGSTGK